MSDSELLLELADALERAAVDLQIGKVENAGHELQSVAWHIQEELE